MLPADRSPTPPKRARSSQHQHQQQHQQQQRSSPIPASQTDGKPSSSTAATDAANPHAAAAAAPPTAAPASTHTMKGSLTSSTTASGSSPLDSALGQFVGGVAGLQGLLESLVSAANAEREALRQSKEQLDQERQQFDLERARVQQVLSDSDQMVLNVGGQRFTTTINTLRNAPSPSLFSAMFSGRYDLVRGADGAVFIDRDGRHFADIINYLRTRQLAYPPDGTDYKYLLELRAEAEFYGLQGLVSIIDKYPYSVTRVVRASSMNLEDSWMYEDGQDEVVFSVDSTCQLLGVGLCGTDAAYTAELEVLEVDPEDFSIELARLAEAGQTFTKSDGKVCRLQLPEPVMLQPGKFYMLSALVKGPESYCGEDCLETVVVGGVRVTFQCWESPNGTNEQRGQFPELYIRVLNSGI
eukprot:jgi/Chrzof1/14248/Cz08g30300.t1